MDERFSEVQAWLLPRWSQQEWMAEAVCSGHTQLFFPPPAERPQSRLKREAAARAVCESCPVIVECRTYARIHREHGFWGGESEEERTLAGFSPPHPIGAARLRAVI
jgi:WhiB family transcriptional regulator, redox-sensing transcriptional regulator